MIFVACSGFPVPVSRYWQEFPAVEIAETELGLPGSGTVRRWMREAPADYGFSMVAPKSIAESGFAVNAANQAVVKEAASLAKKIQSRAVVFSAPPEWRPTKANRTAARAFAESLKGRGTNFVIDLQGFSADELRAVVKGTPVIAAYDPLSAEPGDEKKLAYLRLPGPAGHRSRYDDAALERLAARCVESKAEVVFCAFLNIDMYANAKKTMQLIKALKR